MKNRKILWIFTVIVLALLLIAINFYNFCVFRDVNFNSDTLEYISEHYDEEEYYEE